MTGARRDEADHAQDRRDASSRPHGFDDTAAHDARRPSGEPPALPRTVSASTRWCLASGVAVVALWVALALPAGRRVVTGADLAVLRVLDAVRTAPATSVMKWAAWLASPWVVRVLAWGTLVVLLATRRFQHLFTVLALFLAVASIDALVAIALGRMRPVDVEVLGHWSGYAHPSRPVSTLALAVVVVLYTAVPAGRWRNRVATGAIPAVALLAFARHYHAVDHPTDVHAALVIGLALPVAVFRLATPDDAFPVRYGRHVRAHLDVGGRRGAAISAAVERQLGFPVAAVEPFELRASAGSTPLRLRLRTRAGEPPVYLFAKLYAVAHLRSDRWYKLGRAVLYGRLEDEHPFNAVRRLVEYEDHMLRLMRDAGVHVPAPYGFAEITPEREYVLVTEFFDGAVAMAPHHVTVPVMDHALEIVRAMWDTGLAHRDVKPGNLLVRGDDVILVDAAFAEARPTPWRQAVDLANMMLTLALGSTPDDVYARALRLFSPADVAEAFAATHGVTVPAQLRTLLRADGRDLVTSFRALAPERRPVPIQRWTARRIGLTAGIVLGFSVALALVLANLRVAGLL
jgi:tRNA A-37 threonylcarbamoyl transferase component Bud32